MSLETYISELSKYVIAFIMILYTLECFLVFLRKSEEKRKGLYIRQNILMFAFHFCSFMVICFETGEISFLFFYAFQQIVLYAAIMLYRGLYPKTNGLIVNNMCMLISISFVFLTRLDYSKAVKQFMIGSTSIVIALIIPVFIHNLSFIKNLKWIYAIAGIFLLGIVYVLGATTYGSKISYSIAGLTFQPAEFVKIIFVFFIASALYESATIVEILATSIIAALHVAIQVLNKDLGSALIFFIIYIFMIYIASKKFIYLILGFAGASGACVIAYKLFSHIRVRVQAYKDPWSVIDSAGYQITQSLFAISSGGFWGLGLYKGTPDSIPFVEDDFIFSAIAEEMGIIFAICLILVCVSSFIMIMNMSAAMQDKFYQLIAFGLGIGYIFQVFLTIGGGTKFIPLTGVTLPLVSYGGSSILTTLIMFAIIEGLYMIREDEAIKVKRINEELERKEIIKRRKIKERKRKEQAKKQRERDYIAKHGKYAYEDDEDDEEEYYSKDDPEYSNNVADDYIDEYEDYYDDDRDDYYDDNSEDYYDDNQYEKYSRIYYNQEEHERYTKKEKKRK